jgi:SAM-dependent methyltransferase
MRELRQQTIDTYDQSAEALAEYFRGIGPRVHDIDLAFLLAGEPEKARVLEIGCGDGRDAKDIIRRTPNYRGFDVSSSMIRLARSHVPEGEFEVADAMTYEYTETQDIVFAFASLLHLDKEEVTTVLKKVHIALRIGGIFFISLKEKPEYTEELKEDDFGKRLFYFYNADIIGELAGTDYETVALSNMTIGHTKWFEIALKKV